MRREWFILLIITFFYNTRLLAQKPLMPFPRHVQYFKGVVKPSHISQNELDRETDNFYTQWKKQFVKTMPGKQQDYIWFENIGGKQCVSEGQGYGMIIVTLMAGFDPSAKITFDNLYRYYHAHLSNRGKHLMAWAQDIKGKNIEETSATDGDMDIAYSLLLANKQWGSNGAINYLKDARAMIGDIMEYDINHKIWSVLLSNAVEHDSNDYFDMRSSDFMPASFKAFRQATNDVRWDKVIGNNYKLFKYMQDNYSPDAGLVPDFIVHIDKKAKPALPHYLESEYDGYYNYNACRVPWRVATDYLLTGDTRSKAMVDKINRWIRETTRDNPDNISAGYTLEGNDLKARYFEALSFIGPFAVSAMVDKKNQQWLNAVWNYTVQFKLKDFDYYDNSIKMLDMIILSGNYWEPDKIYHSKNNITY